MPEPRDVDTPLATAVAPLVGRRTRDVKSGPHGFLFAEASWIEAGGGGKESADQATSFFLLELTRGQDLDHSGPGVNQFTDLIDLNRLRHAGSSFDTRSWALVRCSRPGKPRLLRRAPHRRAARGRCGRPPRSPRGATGAPPPPQRRSGPAERSCRPPPRSPGPGHRRPGGDQGGGIGRAAAALPEGTDSAPCRGRRGT